MPALIVSVGVLTGPVAQAEVTVDLVYRVTLQTPGAPQQAEISYRVGDNPNGGDLWATDVVTVTPFVPWEHAVTIHTRWASAYPMVSVFSDPGGQCCGEILRDANVVGSGSGFVLPPWAPTDAPPGTPVMLARATVS
ncbi:hypothetical protein H7I02_03775 [Mycolicibacterium brumae]|uniref:Uncharacterized protein n=1 Tax=Mycolicibacterium brumae TaxID=85968 RepID=A0A2G5PFS3_9MYCO|nr:hypothetical protein [Mycolicibacterium brumae]PIB76980.1 hypothetical protein CQY22_004295 [Mycolicibacterium brumae]